MQPHEVAPPAALRAVIKCFWYLRLDLGPQPTRFEVLPDGYAEIVFLFGSACTIATAQGQRPLPSPFLMGLLNQPAWVQGQGQLEILGIRCFPWTVFELLGLAPTVDGACVGEHPLAQLQAPLAEYLRLGQQAEALAYLAQHAGQARPPRAGNALLGKAGDALQATHGTLPVREVAAAAHATVRTLERQFKQAAGHTVKDVAGLMRFEQVRNRLWRQPDTSLAGLAHELGYADQAHLSREFKRYSGTTPAAFARLAKRR